MIGLSLLHIWHLLPYTLITSTRNGKGVSGRVGMLLKEGNDRTTYQPLLGRNEIEATAQLFDALKHLKFLQHLCSSLDSCQPVMEVRLNTAHFILHFVRKK